MNSNHIKLIEERIEERTNRQLRKTLVFRGIPEKSSEGAEPGQPETWAETEAILAKEIAKHCELPEDVASGLVERAHRSAPNPRYKGTGPRPIFAALYDWKKSELCKEKFKEKNIAKAFSITCDQKCGPLTQMRRNLAMQERKSLKESNAIIAGYVSFPARLMVKEKKDGKYFCIKDFSKVPVELGKRD